MAHSCFDQHDSPRKLAFGLCKGLGLAPYALWPIDPGRGPIVDVLEEEITYLLRSKISDQGGAVEAVQRAHDQTWTELAKTKAKCDREFNRADRLEKQVLERDQRIADLERAVVAFAAEKALKSTGS